MDSTSALPFVSGLFPTVFFVNIYLYCLYHRAIFAAQQQIGHAVVNRNNRHPAECSATCSASNNRKRYSDKGRSVVRVLTVRQ